jgi:hypothetical protein
MIGLLRLRTHFPRPIGDGGSPASWREPVRVHELSNASIANVVVDAALPDALCEDIVRAANALADAGARCVTTSCGFFAAIQSKIAPQVRVPFVSSSLCVLPALRADGVAITEIGVLTFDSDTLGGLHYAGVHSPIPAAQIGLLSDSHLRRVITNDEPELDLARAQAELVARAQALKATHPRVTTLILECTNLAPYRVAIAASTGLRTIDLRDAVERLCPMPR